MKIQNDPFILSPKEDEVRVFFEALKECAQVLANLNDALGSYDVIPNGVTIDVKVSESLKLPTKYSLIKFDKSKCEENFILAVTQQLINSYPNTNHKVYEDDIDGSRILAVYPTQTATSLLKEAAQHMRPEAEKAAQKSHEAHLEFLRSRGGRAIHTPLRFANPEPIVPPSSTDRNGNRIKPDPNGVSFTQALADKAMNKNSKREFDGPGR